MAERIDVETAQLFPKNINLISCPLHDPVQTCDKQNFSDSFSVFSK